MEVMRKLPDGAYRIEITLVCQNGHALIKFSRSTLPTHEQEGVIYRRNTLGRFVELDGTDYAGQEWHRINLWCRTPLRNGGTCQIHEQITRDRLEAWFAPLWQPYRIDRRGRVTWAELTA